MKPVSNAESRLHTLLSDLDAAAGHASCAALAAGLRAVLREPPDGEGPVVVALVGGTGAGKSSLFNWLCGRENSPVSSDRRSFTDRLHAAGETDAVQHWARSRGWEGKVTIHEANLPGMILLDTPDLDGPSARHLDLSRAAVEAADVVACLSYPDNIASLPLHREVARAAARKRWIFLLNKIDLVPPEARPTVLEGYRGEIERHGFTAAGDNLYALSVRQPDAPGSQAGLVRMVLCSGRFRERARQAREESWLAAVSLALGSRAADEVAVLPARLAEEEARLESGLREIYAAALDEPAVRRGLAYLVKEELWRLAPGRCGFFIALPVALRVRFAGLWLGWSMGRLVTGRGTALGLLGGLLMSVRAHFRRKAAIEPLADCLPVAAVRRFEAVAADQRRLLEDVGWTDLLGQGDAAGPFPDAPAEGGEAKTGGEWTPVVAAVKELLQGGASAKERLLEPVAAMVTGAARAGSRRLLPWPIRLLANLPPAAVTASVAWHGVTGWIEGSWLPGAFYSHAVLLFILSVLPGYWLTAWRVGALARIPGSATVLETAEAPEVLRPLVRARERAARLADRLAGEKERIETALGHLTGQLDREGLGSRAALQPSTDGAGQSLPPES